MLSLIDIDHYAESDSDEFLGSEDEDDSEQNEGENEEQKQRQKTKKVERVVVTEAILDELENAAMTQRSAAALKQIVLIFCAACHIQDSMPSPSPFLISQAYNFYIYSFVF